MRKDHILYKITNNINGKYYVGIHTMTEKKGLRKDYTCFPKDYYQYWGSSTILKDDIIKHGKENFTREVLVVGPTRKYVADLERSILTKEFVSNPNCYNAASGEMIHYLINKKRIKYEEYYLKDLEIVVRIPIDADTTEDEKKRVKKEKLTKDKKMFIDYLHDHQRCDLDMIEIYTKLPRKVIKKYLKNKI